MDATEKIDITLEKLQSRLERELARNPSNDAALSLLWEVQTRRAENLFSMPLPQLEETACQSLN